MRNTWAVCKREFASSFLTPVGYVVTGLVTAISGLSFTYWMMFYARVSRAPAANGYPTIPDFEETLLSPFLVFCGMLIMFLSPLLTMRLLAEERNRGTIELLFTLPLRDREIVFGKYLAAMGMVLVLMLFLAVDLLIVQYFVAIEPAVLVFGLLTVLLMSGAFVSLGLFISALSRNQITSGILTFGVLLLLYIVGYMGEDLPEVNPTPELWPEMARSVCGGAYFVFRGFITEMALDAHARDMALGVVQPKDIAYYLLFTAFFLFLSLRALESRHWR